jgi:hypothetical protein
MVRLDDGLLALVNSQSVSFIVHIFHDIISRFILMLALYDSQIAFFRSLKVIWVTDVLPIWKHLYLWSDKNSSSDACHLLTVFRILLIPSVKSTSFLLMQNTKVCSLPWWRIFSFELGRYFMKHSPPGLAPLLPCNMWCTLGLQPLINCFCLLQQ